jgi:hypothetical protein
VFLTLLGGSVWEQNPLDHRQHRTSAEALRGLGSGRGDGELRGVEARSSAAC